MIPTMRPSSTRKSTPSSATVVPKALRRPCASMLAMASTLLLLTVRRFPASQQFFRSQAEPANRGVNPRPVFRQKLLALRLQQKIARAGFDEHAATSPVLHQFLVD